MGLVDLLANYRRVSAHLGAGGGVVAPTSTPAQRTTMVALVDRYRWPVLALAHQCAHLAVPAIPAPGRAQAPTVRLAQALSAITTTHADRPGERAPTTMELGTVQERPVLEAWRRVSLAAVEARERDLPALGAPAGLTWAERADIARDVVALCQAMTVLDRRWARCTPGWTPLGSVQDRRSLTSACRAAGAWLADGAGAPTWALDDRGHHPHPGTALPQDPIATAKHLTHLLGQATPGARAARRIANDLAHAYAHAATLATGADHPTHARALTRSARACVDLARELANVGALTTSTGAVPAAAHLRLTLQDTTPAAPASGTDLHALTGALDIVARTLAATVAHAITDRTYLGTWTNRLEPAPVGGVRHARAQFEPITPGNHPGLFQAITTLTHHTTPCPPRPVPPPTPRPRARLAQATSAARWGIDRPPGERPTNPTSSTPGSTGGYLEALGATQRTRQAWATRPTDTPGPCGP
ncbi:hypothetical protein AGMMS50218_16650 [Actinomycetota bacterium]|nr:hypothetical protein AGMMS50218_16650 [Actinomycetota bacterium]